MTLKHLTIIRHAKSSWDNPDLADFDRPLNERGKNAIKIIGKFLKEREIQPDLVISSPAKRAMQTAVGIGKFLNYKAEDLLIQQNIYSGVEKEILQSISSIDDCYSDVFLFGHEPLLSSIIHYFTHTAFEKFPTCSVFRMQFYAEHWKEIHTTKMICEFYVNPKLLL